MILTKQPTHKSLIVFFTAFFISLLFTSCETDPSKKIKEQNVELTKERLKNTGDFACPPGLPPHQLTPRL